MSPLNELESTTCGVLFEASQTTAKSWIPPLPWISRKKGSTIETNCERVNSSLNSNNWNRAAFAIAFSRRMNNLRTLILSNADGFTNCVLSPKRIVPSPGNETTGLTCDWYNLSRSAFFGLKGSFTTPLIWPLVNPPGEKKGSRSAADGRRKASRRQVEFGCRKQKILT